MWEMRMEEAVAGQGALQPRLRSAWASVRRERSRPHDRDAAFSVRAALGSRLIVWAAGLIALAVFGGNSVAASHLDLNGATTPFHSAAANFLVSPAARWDSVWYLTIAHSGYYSYQSSALFPLYPLLMRVVSAPLGGNLLVAGLAISILALIGGLYLLQRLVSLDFDAVTARMTVLLVALFPLSFYFSAVYTESLFLLLSVASIYAARLDRWACAGALGGLAAATRSAGVLLLLALGLIYLYGPRARAERVRVSAWWRPRYRVSLSSAWLAVVPLGLIVYMGYMGVAHHQPFAPFTSEAIWGRFFAGPFGGALQAVSHLPSDVAHVISGHAAPVGTGDPLSWSAHNLIDLGFLAFAAIGLGAAWRRVPVAYFAYAVVLVAQAASYPTPVEPLESLPRYLAVIFPVFIGWAILLRRRRRLAGVAIAGSTLLLVLFSGLWTTWAWIA
jgi:hypothetical protein